MTAPQFLPEYPRSEIYRVFVNGIEVPTLSCDGADFAEWTAELGEEIRVEILVFEASGSGGEPFTVRPRRLAAPVTHAGDRIEFTFEGPGRRLLEPSSQKIRGLALFVEPPMERSEPPPPKVGGRLHRFASGQVHDVGCFTLGAGDVLWIERGAILRGCLIVEGDDVFIGGGGILDVSRRAWGTKHGRGLLARYCGRLRIDGLTVINPGCWMVMIGGSTDSRLSNLRLLGAGPATDGVDVVGSSRIVVEDVFCVNGDDCLVVKAFAGYEDSAGDGGPDGLGFSRNVEEVVFQRCTVGCFLGGSAMEIGHELTAPRVCGVTFREIDVLFVHDFGAVFSIHVADSAEVSRVRYEEIQIEHCFDKLIDLRVLRSRWSEDAERGRIRDVRFENVDWWTHPYNAGYTMSVLGGWDETHLVEEIAFSDFRIDGGRIENIDRLDIHSRYASVPTLETPRK